MCGWRKYVVSLKNNLSLCVSVSLYVCVCLSRSLSLSHTHTHTQTHTHTHTHTQILARTHAFCNSFSSRTEQAPTRSREAQNQLMKMFIGKKPRLFHSYKIYHSVELRNLHTYTIGAHAQTNLNDIFARATFSSNETKYASAKSSIKIRVLKTKSTTSKHY